MIERVNIDGLFRMPSTSHAVVVDGIVYVSGVLGTIGDGLELARGGVAGQTKQALGNVERVLGACGADFTGLVRTNVYLTSPEDFLDMEQAYAALVTTAPARIVVYCSALPLGAAVEIDAVAHRSR